MTDIVWCKECEALASACEAGNHTHTTIGWYEKAADKSED